MVIDLTFNAKVSKEISNGDKFARVMCLKGANSSGKTSALKALTLCSRIATNSFSLKPNEDLSIETFFDSKEPTEFFLDFRIGEINYSYELVVTNTAIVSEKLYRTEKRKTLVLYRNGIHIEKDAIFGPRKDIIIRENASVISTANQYEIPEIVPIYSFFFGIITNVGYGGLYQELLDYNTLSKYYSQDKDSFRFVKSFIKKFDPCIKDIEIETYTNDKKEKVYYPRFIHAHLNGTGTLRYHAQSSGTKSLFYFLYFYCIALSNGWVLALDEFDINLHPDILPHLVALFYDKTFNAKNAQLIFTTHNTDIIDSMGKYRTYLFNKENGASYCYRLDELPPNLIRNDRPISALYKSGKIGGVPKI
jgi:AAA15 family ATPase/GTPase